MHLCKIIKILLELLSRNYYLCFFIGTPYDECMMFVRFFLRGLKFLDKFIKSRFSLKLPAAMPEYFKT